MLKRTTTKLWIALAGAVLASLLISASAGAEATNPYIVVLEDSVAHPANVAERHEDNRDAEIGHIYGTAIKGYSAELSAEDLKAVKRDPTVAYVERDVRMKAYSQTISTGFKRIYGLGNPTLDIDEKDDVQVNVDVAVIDSGVDFDHPDLRVVARANCVTVSGGGGCASNAGNDIDGHGSHVAGIIGARDNSFGVVGVAPGARIWSVKTIEEDSGNMSDVVAGIDWVRERAGQIEVANMSLGCPDTPDYPDCSENSNAMQAAINNSINAGVVFVVAAGNDLADVDGLSQFGIPPAIPAAFNDPITVSNLSDFDGKPGGLAPLPPAGGGCNPYNEPNKPYLVDKDDTLRVSSNWGEGVDIAAPGTCIISTYKNDGYETMSGTSMAAPHVAGAAAILAGTTNPITKTTNPNSRTDVEVIRAQLLANGNSNWTDDGVFLDANDQPVAGPDGVKEPLLSIDNETVFKVPHPGNVTNLGVTSHTAGAMQMFARTETGKIAAKDYNPYANPFGWQPWGDGVALPNNNTIPIVGVPAVISRNANSRDLFVRGTDAQLYYRNWDTDHWSSWFWIVGPNNSTITSSASAVANPGIKDALSLVVRGSGNQVYLKNYDPAYGWAAWQNLGAPPGGATSDPAVTIHSYGTIHVMVRGGNNAIWDRAWSAATGWTGWISLGGTLTSTPALTVTNAQKDIYLFARGTDNAVWFRRFVGANLTWAPWASLGGNWISEPASTTRDGFGVDVFAVGTDGKAQHRRYINSSGTWTNWMRVDDECPPGAC